jgi:hypothetical protein
MQHDWTTSTLGHGETLCSRCFITNREAAALGLLNTCDAPSPKVANENWPQDRIDDDGEPPMVCPVTGQVCLTEQDEFCDDYGCARESGIDVDRDLYA